MGAKTHEDVSERIQALIAKERYEVGARLPSERALAELLGVGRPSIREALRGLQSLGVVKTRRGSGTVVAALDKPTLAEVHESCELIGVFLASRAAEQRTEEDLKQIELALPNLIQFHEAIAAAANNTLLGRILVGLLGKADETPACEEIVDAIRRQKPKAARKAMRRHLRLVFKRPDTEPLDGD